MERSWVRVIIVAAIALVVIIILITLLIFLFTQFTNLTQRTPVVLTPTPIATPSPTPTSTPTSTPTPTPTPTITLDMHQGPDFILFFPQNWGILTCINSANFEFDPINNIDQKKFCTVASKPITVLVENDLSECSGKIVILGNILIIRSTTTTSLFTTHKWCTITQPVLKFTHRVSPTLNNAFSRENFSQEVEFVISTLRFS